MIGGRDQLFIGWDVGDWNCDKNPNSRDALVVLDGGGAQVGQPWRGNLRQALNPATTAADFLTAILDLCKLPPPIGAKATIAIDAPLRFPAAFARLIPLSAIKDMIGSQSTKAMHAAARYARRIAPGIWSDGTHLTLIETYTAICRSRARAALNDLATATTARESDILDAEVCVQIPRVFVQRPDRFERPPSDAPASEGWIWAPLPKTPREEVQV